MTARVRNITFDCRDPAALVRFWAVVSGLREDPDDRNLPGDTEMVLVGRDGAPNLLFIAVPEAKAGKNRVHVDLQPLDLTRDAQVAVLLDAGATMLDDRRRADGSGWVVLADPEGNELCVERSTAERAAAAGE